MLLTTPSVTQMLLNTVSEHAINIFNVSSVVVISFHGDAPYGFWCGGGDISAH